MVRYWQKPRRKHNIKTEYQVVGSKIFPIYYDTAKLLHYIFYLELSVRLTRLWRNWHKPGLGHFTWNSGKTKGNICAIFICLSPATIIVFGTQKGIDQFV